MNINIEENKELKEVKAILSDNEKNYDSIRKKMGEDNQERRYAEEKIKELDLEISKSHRDSQDKQREVALNKLKIKELEEKIATNEFNYKVKDLLDDQPSFWSVLKDRIEHHQKELDTGLEGLSSPPKPEEVIVELKALIAGHNFSHQAVNIRGAEGEYNKLIKELCESVVKGHKVSVQQKKRKIDLLDRFLMSNDIIRLWGE